MTATDTCIVNVVWINMRNGAELTVSGAVSLNAVALSTGWNLVGFESTDSRNMSDAIF